MLKPGSNFCQVEPQDRAGPGVATSTWHDTLNAAPTPTAAASSHSTTPRSRRRTGVERS